jgi:Protein of unknown function (DUF3376)/Patatin-like phospholipase
MATGEQRKQVRLALVVEGGVSLAVWMSGVVHEVDLLRRAGAPDRDEPEPDGPDGEALRRWRTLCDELRVDVVVDIVAGTSAGGLNGALLASAIASGSPLPPLRDLWLKTAELTRDKLLNEADRGPVPSVLNGACFETEVGRAVRAALVPGRPAVHPISLLTTATALGQQSAQWKDSTGRQFHVDDHRRVYVFRHDPDRKAYTPRPGEQSPAGVEELFTPCPWTDLKAANADVVTRAVRATAGFPGAFAPVDEGGLHRFCLTPGTPVAKLVDGGVLDNAPFEPLLAEVARREVNGPWQRVIGYVVANDGLETLPNGEPALDAVGVLSAALRMPAETSFRDGVEALARRSLDAQRLVSGPEALFSQLLVDGVDLKVLEPIYTVYRRVRTESGLLDARAVRHADVRSVTMQPRPTVDPDAAAPWVPGADLAEAVRPGEFVWGTAVADRSVRLLLRHLHQSGGDHDGALQHLSALTTRIAAVRDHVEQTIKRTWAENSDPENADESEGVRIITEAVVAADAPRVLGVLVDDAIKTYTDARGRCTSDDVRRALLAVEIITHASAGHLPFSRPARFDLVRMGPDVACPALPSSNGEDWGGEQKLYGRQLMHFGAFGSREWRRHDYIWGRLDGAAHLVRLLAACTDAQEWKDSTDPECEQKQGDRTVAAQEAVLAAEGITATDLAENSERLRHLDGHGTLNLLRDCDDGRDAIRGVATDVLRALLPEKERATRDGAYLRLWGRRRCATESSRAPRRSVVPGQWASVVLAAPVARGVAPLLVPRAVRLIATWPRRRIWKTILRPSPAQQKASRAR